MLKETEFKSNVCRFYVNLFRYASPIISSKKATGVHIHNNQGKETSLVSISDE